MAGDTLSRDFRYDGYTFTLANGQALDLLAYEYLSCEIATGTNLEVARRNSNSFAPFYHRQVLGDSIEGEIGLVRIRNNSGGSVTGTIITSSRRIAWGGQIQISGTVATTITGVDIEGTNADAEAVKTTGALATESYSKGFNGTTWDRIRSGGNNNDAEDVETAGVVKSESYAMVFNGTTWDRLRGDSTGGMYVQGKVNDGSAHGTHKPVLVGGTDGTNAQTISTDANGYVKVIVGTGTLAVSGTVTASGTVGTAAHDAAASGNPVQVCGVTRTDNPTTLANGDACSLTASTGRMLGVIPYQIPENTWQYAAAASGIVNSTTGVTAKAAAAAGLRNYVTGLDLSWDSLTTATEFVINDGAAGTVLFRHKIPNGGAGRTAIRFPVPLRGTAATLVEIKTLTASGAGGVFCNLQGHVAP